MKSAESAGTRRLKVLVFDQSHRLRDASWRAFAEAPGIELTGCQGDAARALEQLLDQQPDVFVLVVPPAGDQALRLAVLARRLSPHLAIVVLVDGEPLACFHDLLRLGISHYWPASEPAGAFAAEIARVAKSVQPMADLDTATLARAESLLSERELEVLPLLALGNLQIADRLVISRKTVEFHVEHITAKLRVDNRIQALIVALDRGLLTLPDIQAAFAPRPSTG
jgi:DNA-binding NarL/FixJ family response regulator